MTCVFAAPKAAKTKMASRMAEVVEALHAQGKPVLAKDQVLARQQKRARLQ